jgi:hypothetical protein
MAKPDAAVKMVKTYGNNVAGDICAFPRATADELVKKGAAEFLVELDARSEVCLDGKAVPMKVTAAKA